MNAPVKIHWVRVRFDFDGGERDLDALTPCRMLSGDDGPAIFEAVPSSREGSARLNELRVGACAYVPTEQCGRHRDSRVWLRVVVVDNPISTIEARAPTC